MKNRLLFTSALAAALLLSSCATSPTSGVVTDSKQQIANAVEDALGLGLVPVLVKNPSYVAAAQSVAAALGSFSGTTITPADVDAVLAKAKIAPEDARAIAGILNAAWTTYEKRYAQQVSAGVRPDVKLFLSAVSAGINAAIAAVPKQ